MSPSKDWEKRRFLPTRFCVSAPSKGPFSKSLPSPSFSLPSAVASREPEDRDWEEGYDTSLRCRRSSARGGRTSTASAASVGDTTCEERERERERERETLCSSPSIIRQPKGKRRERGTSSSSSSSRATAVTSDIC